MIVVSERDKSRSNRWIADKGTESDRHKSTAKSPFPWGSSAILFFYTHTCGGSPKLLSATSRFIVSALATLFYLNAT